VRVLTVSNAYPPHYAGGHELVCRGAVESLRATGHRVRVLVGDRHSNAGGGDRDDPDVHRDLQLYWHGGAATKLSVRGRLALERHNAATLARHLRELRPDVVAWWGMGGMSLSLVEQVRAAGIPAVAFVGDDWLDYAPPADAWLRMFASRPWLGRPVAALTGLPTRVDWDAAATYVFVSESLRRQAPPLPRTAVEHPGVDRAFLDPRPAAPWSWRLLALGRMDPRKGFATAIEALAALPEATLTIAGGGPEAEVRRLRALAEQLGVGDRIAWLGPRGRAELPQLYADHDAVLFPVIWAEPFGLVPLEAMGIGRPVVATGRGGSGEYLRDGENCLLHPAEDAAALAAAVRRLAGDDGLVAQLRTGGERTAARFTMERFEAAVLAQLQAAAGVASAATAAA
jgi:glycosyltransferase involved in cell wall biosynthesis